MSAYQRIYDLLTESLQVNEVIARFKRTSTAVRKALNSGDPKRIEAAKAAHATSIGAVERRTEKGVEKENPSGAGNPIKALSRYRTQSRLKRNAGLRKAGKQVEDEDES